MALGDPGQDEIENPPVSIVAPQNLNIDPSTMRFDPMGYMSMLGEALGNLIGPSSAEAAEPTVTPPATPIAHHDPIEAAATHQVSPESQPFMSALDNNYADKKFFKPVEDIRKGIQSGDELLVKKGHKALTDVILGEQTFGDWYNDVFAGHSQKRGQAQKIAGDVVMREIAQATGLGMPRVEEATRLGLIRPEELIPGMQAETIPGAATPGYSGFTPEMQPIPAPRQAPTTTPVAGARLTPFQQEVAESRQKAIQSGLAYKAALAGARGELAAEKAETARVERELLLPEKVRDLKSKQRSRLALDALREAQVGLTEARTEWYKQLPGLRRELASGTSPIEIEALRRVQTAIREKTPIDKADWLVADRWLRKGMPPYMMDFMGRGFNRFTGEKESKGKAFGWLGLPEPPSTTEEERAEASEIDEDLLSQFGSYIGSLIQGITGGKKEPEAKKPETGLSAAEKSELEQLRKKHGRSK